MGSGITKRSGEVLGALDRIKRLEQGLTETIQGCSSSFDLVEKRLRSVEELVAALVNVAGADAVFAGIETIQKKERQDAIDAANQAIATAVADGKLTAMEVLPNRETIEADADKSLRSKILVVGRQFDKEGNLKDPGHVQLPLVNVLEAVQLELAGKRPGDTIQLPDGSFTLDQAWIETPEAA